MKLPRLYIWTGRRWKVVTMRAAMFVITVTLIIIWLIDALIRLAG